jgi:hypothetical protein
MSPLCARFCCGGRGALSAGQCSASGRSVGRFEIDDVGAGRSGASDLRRGHRERTGGAGARGERCPRTASAADRASKG